MGKQDNEKSYFWVLLFTFISAIVPFGMTANAQVIGKAMEQKMKDVPDGLEIPPERRRGGAETRDKQTACRRPIRCPKAMRQSLLKRLPEIKPHADDQTEFAKRIGTLPAPKTGKQDTREIPVGRAARHAEDRTSAIRRSR